MHHKVKTEKAPGAIGPYSQAIKVVDPESMLFVSGQVGLDPTTGQMVQGGLEAETRQVLANLKAIVEASGFSIGDVARTTIYLTDMADFATVNDLYSGLFSEVLPARATFAVKGLPKNALVEIDAVCVRARRA